jgi:hypothetical protein
MFRTGGAMVDAETAFTRARRRSRLGALRGGRDPLPVFDGARSARGRGGVRTIPLEAIGGTVEPSRAAQFDASFRPIRRALRTRWERVWIAEERGIPLPPISVVPVGQGYAVQDGHHRVSVARARGAIAIDATIASGY